MHQIEGSNTKAKIIVKETMREDVIGQWIKPAEFELSIVPIHANVFDFTLNVAFGAFTEYKNYILKEYGNEINSRDAAAMFNSFEDRKGRRWHFINIQKNDWTANDYGTIAHELHHAVHYGLSSRGIDYHDTSEEVFAYLQGYLMEMVVRAFQKLLPRNKKKRK